MTQEDTSTQQQIETPATAQPEISSDQWQQFLGNLQAQNNELQAQLTQTQVAATQDRVHRRREEIASLPDKERAEALQQQLDGIAQAGQAAQAQEVSNSVWQRRDADAAARLLSSHNLTGTEPELYRSGWDVNWMPRFVASVDNLVKTKATKSRSTNTNPAENPANRANVGSSTSSALPEIDPTASGFDTIKFALSRGKT